MEQTTKDLIKVVDKSIKKLHHGIDVHCCLVNSILELGGGQHNLCSFPNLAPMGTRELKLRESIKEAIDILEESRKAFKSKRLEALRKKLTQILIDTD